jgi:SRSO17 transposase
VNLWRRFSGRNDCDSVLLDDGVPQRQIGVFASYVSRHGHAFIDRALYLPKVWTDVVSRMNAAHVPFTIEFASKPRLAVAMIERALATHVPFAWVAADAVYGVGDIEIALRRAGKGYVLGVRSDHAFHSWDKPDLVSGTAATIAEALPVKAWRRLSAGKGTKGARLHDWAYIKLAELDGASFGNGRHGTWTRGLLIRRTIADGDMAFFTTWCPAGTTAQTLVMIGGHRWAIEDSFETAKNELGLDHNETRSWQGWHRHVSLVMLAFAMMARIRHQANTNPPKTSSRPKQMRQI